MAEIPNVTGRIAELRENKRAKSLTRSPLPDRPPSRKNSPKGKERKPPGSAERKIAPNAAVFTIYSGLFLALLTQLVLISLLDLL